MVTRVCRLCNQPKDEEKDFYHFQQMLRSGTVITTIRTECIECNKGKSKSYAQANPDYYLYQNIRGNDRRAGHACELTREDVRRLIKHPCHYCGALEERMSIDRKDSSIGHTHENSVPCCLRCNSIKRDMPYEAWLILVPAVRTAQLSGLFGNWVGHSAGPRKSRVITATP
jgi:hypothetical protein